MALSRKYLAGLGITEEQIEAIIEAHTETVDALKKARDGFKADAEKLPVVQRELDDLKATQDAPDEWKEKYDKEHADFEAYKTAQAEKETNSRKETAYRALLKAAGVADKRMDAIVKVTDLAALKLTDEGKLHDADTLTKSIKETWSDFITTTEEEGAETKTPPDGGNDGDSVVPDIPSFF